MKLIYLTVFSTLIISVIFYPEYKVTFGIIGILLIGMAAKWENLIERDRNNS